MMAAAWYFLLKGWALVSPVFGPAWSLFRNFVPIVNPLRFLVPIIAIGGVLWVGWHALKMLEPGWSPQVVSVDSVVANRQAAEIRSLKEAMADKDVTLSQREVEIEAQRQEYEALKKKLTEARDASISKNPDASGRPFISSDDPWMRE